MKKLVPYFAFVFVAAVMLWQAAVPETVLMPEPKIVFPEIAGYTVEEGQPSEAELKTLPKDTVIFKRIYSDAVTGHRYQVSVVIGGRSKSSVHRPELCLPAQGFELSDPHTIDVGVVGWRRINLRRGTGGYAGFAYTYANGTGFRTSSHLVRIFTDVWDRSILGRIDRWVAVSVTSSLSEDEALAAFLDRLKGVVSCP